MDDASGPAELPSPFSWPRSPSSSSGSSWAGSIAVIGGLLVSTFFTLVLIPTLYVIFEERWPRTLVEEAGEDVEPASDQPT